jgi:hypothetical protein
MKKIRFIFETHPLLVIILIALVLQGVFLLFGLQEIGIGFPLDDAWIHQTYARNLMESGSWSFVPGTVSGGSTSPLWTLFLSPGFLFAGKFSFYWTLALSSICFGLLVYLMGRSLLQTMPEIKIGYLFLFGSISALEWHLLWATASGMETILFCLVIVFLFSTVTKTNISWLLVGILSGILIWIRPDGLTLIGPVVFVALQAIKDIAFNWRKAAKVILPFIFFLTAYLAFNWLITGRFFPNTFYAKQMEYSELLLQPLWKRIISEFSPLLTGGSLFLLPGFIYETYRNIRQKNFINLGFIIWVLAYVCMYAVRLPVVYQHGRYIIPVIPLFLLFGTAGTFGWLETIKKPNSKRLAVFIACALLVSISVAYYVLGVKAYRSDLQVIDRFMVQPAKWINQHSDEGAIIAVHDIGAMGYFSDREMIDLAGLINPEVIPFIRDEEKIHDYILEKQADYFVGFNNWYESSSDWGEIKVNFNMIVDGNFTEVDIIKLKY